MIPAETAALMVAAVRDDAEARIRLAADTYLATGGRRLRPYAAEVVDFMGWQRARGVLDARDGSPWWRAVNEDLLRDTLEASLIVRDGGVATRPAVQRWVRFFEAPSAKSWYLAHNGSVVEGYLAHRDLALAEGVVERFFMNVVLVRVLYAQALVCDGRLALGRLAFLARLIGHPRARGPQLLLSLTNVLPAQYPIAEPLDWIIDVEHPVGRVLDRAVIATRTHALYASAAHALDEPRLLDLVDRGTPGYAWPAALRSVWTRLVSPQKSVSWASSGRLGAAAAVPA